MTRLVELQPSEGGNSSALFINPDFVAAVYYDEDAESVTVVLSNSAEFEVSGDLGAIVKKLSN